MTIHKGLSIIDSTILAAHIAYTYGPMSHLKLQKLLYLIEGYHLAYFDGASVIKDEFQAWVHGPVSRKIYDELKDKSILYGDIKYELEEGEEEPIERLRRELASEQIELIEEVLSLYKGESGIALEGITHKQQPWINARKGYGPADKCEEIINRDDMKNYFSNLINTKA